MNGVDPPRVSRRGSIGDVRSSARLPVEIQTALLRRGLTVREDDIGQGQAHLPPAFWEPDRVEILYERMLRYSFRLVLRDVMLLGQSGAPFAASDLTRHASLAVAEEHIRFLVELELVQGTNAGFEVAFATKNLGPTLEWFVAEVLRRELGFVVAHGVPLRGGRTGGDLDVVALAEGKLIYVEVKSGPPKHLDLSHVTAFLERVDALAPHGAIFLEDTELRMTDKMVVLFEEALLLRRIARRPARLQRELFAIGPGIYLANTYPDVVQNLAFCVEQLFRAGGVHLDMDLGTAPR